MSVVRRRFLGTFAFISLFTVMVKSEVVEAANYTVDRESDLIRHLESTSNDTVTLDGPITLNSRVTVKANKVLDLNGETITAKVDSFNRSGGFDIVSSPGFTKFTVKNGTFDGGPTESIETATGTTDSTAGLFYSKNKEFVNVEFQDITHNGDGFFKGRSADVTFKGKITLNNTAFNVRALNMDMYANPVNPSDPENTDFYGYVDREGSNGQYATGTGGLNLTFDGKSSNTYKDVGRPVKVLNVPRNAKVKLKNDQTESSLRYANNVGNFGQINVNGVFEAESQGTSLRTIAPYYEGEVGTASDQAEVNVNPGSVFKISTVNEKNTYGVIYTYSIDINVKEPKVFDLRNFGEGIFFHGWSRREKNNFRIYNSDVGVWTEASQGVGNPLHVWQDVDYVTILKFDNGDKGDKILSKVSSSNPDLQKKFTINEFSRISNDVALPMTVPSKKVVGNNETKISGSTAYYLPDGEVVNKPAPGAKLTMTILGKTYQTVADDEGKWSFEPLDLSNIPGGTTAQIDLVDADKRTAKPVQVKIEDRIPPKASPKLIKAELNDMTNLTNPKDAFASFGDETTSNAQLKFEYLTDLEARQNMVKKVGKYDVEAKVTDAAGNPTTIMAPVIVYEPQNPPTTNGFASGKDFQVDFDKWKNASDDEKRQIMIDENYGAVKGYEISGNTVTEVTDNPSKMTMSFSGFNWEPKKTYPIEVKVGTFKTSINVTLVPAAVKMNIKQVYEGTDKAIYKDLSTNTPVDNTPKYDVKIGDPIEDVVKALIDSGKIKMNYTGYNNMDISNYQVKTDGQVIQTDRVPDKSFDLVYEYQGQMKFEKAPTLNFGDVKISDTNTRTKLAAQSQDEVKIINTFLDYGWTLKAALPNGIINQQTDEEFLGKLIYIDGTGKEHPITKTGAKLISQSTTDKSLSTVDVRGVDSTGMRLEQHIGNKRDQYSGDLVWSLEDTP